MARTRVVLIAGTGLVLATVLYLPHLTTASWLYWESLTALWSTETPTMGTRVLPWLLHLTWPGPAETQVAQFVLHVVVAGLIAGLLRGLGASPAWATTGGVLLLVNPVAVEAVRHGTGGADLLVAVGTVGACLAALHRWWLAMGLGLVVALLSKETGIVSLALVPLVLWIGRVRVSQTWVVWYAVSVWLVGLGVLTWAHAEQGVYNLINRDQFAVEMSGVSWGLLQGTATLRLLTTALTGLGMTTDFDYDRVRVTMQVVSVLALGGLAGLAWSVRASAPLVAMGLAWVLVASALRWVVQTPAAYYSEHQFYVGLVGLVCAVVGMLTVSSKGAAQWQR